MDRDTAKELSTEIVVATSLVLLAGSFVQGLTSFGYAVVAWIAYGVLTQLGTELPDFQTFLVCLTCFACSTISAFNLALVRQRVAPNALSVLLALALEFPGNYAGVWFERRVPEWLLRLGIGCLFVLMSAPKITSELLFCGKVAAAVAPKPANATEASASRPDPSLYGEAGETCASAVAEDGAAAPPFRKRSKSPDRSLYGETCETCAGAIAEGSVAAGAEGADPWEAQAGRWRMPESECTSTSRFAMGLLVIGLTSGFCHGSVGIPGPPWMLFFAFTGVGKADARAIFATFELIGSLNFIITYSVAGELKRQSGWLYAVAAVACAVGTPLGNVLHARVSQYAATMSLLLLALLSGMQALRAFDMSDRVGAWARLLALVWAAGLCCACVWRWCRRRSVSCPCWPHRLPGAA